MTKVCAVVGSAVGALEELGDALTLNCIDYIIAVNQAALHVQNIDAWVTLHPENLKGWWDTRRAKGWNRPTIISYSMILETKVPHRFPLDMVIDYKMNGMTNSGSSGLYGVKVAMDLGFDRIILCGVPMDASRKHIGSYDDWDEVSTFREAWVEVLPQLRGRVKSMSGWTRELLSS